MKNYFCKKMKAISFKEFENAYPWMIKDENKKLHENSIDYSHLIMPLGNWILLNATNRELKNLEVNELKQWMIIKENN